METKTIYIVGNATFETFTEAKDYENYLMEKEFNELFKNNPFNYEISLDKFNKYQLEEIKLGLKDNLDVNLYANPRFSAGQMELIRQGIKKGLDIKHYANPKFYEGQMRQIVSGLEEGLDVSIYNKPEYNYGQMNEIQNLKLIKWNKSDWG